MDKAAAYFYIIVVLDPYMRPALCLILLPQNVFGDISHVLPSSFYSLVFNSKYLETPSECPYKLYKRANCSSLHIFSSGLGTGKGSVKLQNYKKTD
jgi:hypothetical protein